MTPPLPVFADLTRTDLLTHRDFMICARLEARKSTCPSRQVGAIVGSPSSVLGSGHNGPIDDSFCQNGSCDWPRENRATVWDLSGCPALHAEAAAVYSTVRKDAASLPGSCLYCNCGVPCGKCLVTLSAFGVHTVVCRPEVYQTGTYYDHLSRRLVRHHVVEVHVLHEEGLVQLTGGEE